MMVFQVSHSSQRHTLMQVPNTAASDLHAKFSPSSPFFANTALDYAHDQLSIDMFVFTHGKDQFKNL